jgi:hypothetical protein
VVALKGGCGVAVLRRLAGGTLLRSAMMQTIDASKFARRHVISVALKVTCGVMLPGVVMDQGWLT